MPMKRFLLITLLLAVGVFILFMPINQYLKKTLTKVASETLNVPVTMDSAEISLTKWRLIVKNLVVPNPEGFQSAHALKLNEIEVKFRPATLFTDTIIIDKLNLIKPDITFEVGFGRTNLDSLLKNAQQKQSGANSGTAQSTSHGDESKEKQLIIRSFKIKEAAVTTALIGASETITLEEIHLRNIGKAKGGVSPAYATEQMLLALIAGLSEADLHGFFSEIKINLKQLQHKHQSKIDGFKDGLKGVGDALKQGTEGLGDDIKSIFE